MHTILSYLENAACRYKEKTIYRDAVHSITFGELNSLSKSIGTAVAEVTKPEDPVLVLAGRNIYTPACYLGIAMAGCFYAPIDPTVPDIRMQQIIGVVNAAVMITDHEHLEKAQSLGFTGKILIREEIEKTAVREEALASARKCITDASPLYVLFTSGSTGVPKGVLTSHHAALSYLEGLQDVIRIDETDVIGNQAPLDYIAAIRDMYLPLMTGAETFMLDASEFAMPDRLLDSLAKAGATTLCWSATGLEIPARLGAFDDLDGEAGSGEGVTGDGIALPPLRRVVFSGSVISNTLLRKWQEAFPETVFINQYGPTEATGSCTYHIIDHFVEPDEIIPIGIPYMNYRIILLDDDNKIVPQGGTGEICVLGSALALGYYHSPEQTAKSFVLNPANDSWNEPVYKTGDLGRTDENGVLYFLGRKDRQFKHLGHRIEPEEIEQKALLIPDLNNCVCLYNAEAKNICLFYTGEATKKDISMFLRSQLPSYMVPRKIKQLDEMPRLPNGKIDQKAIRAML